jgi:hypothetical protein
MYWLTGILGALLVLAPFILGYRDNATALWTSVVLCAVIILVSLIEGLTKDDRNWEYWVAGLTGVLAVIALFVFGFSAITASVWASIVIGAMVTILAGTKVFASTA